VPTVARVGLLFHPATAAYAGYYLEPFKTTARDLGVEPLEASVRDIAEVEATIAMLARGPGGGLVVMPTSFNGTNRGAIISQAARYRLPAMYPYRFFTTDGGLASYGIDSVDLYRRAASYVDRILRGAKPADLPVQQPTRFELTINLKTARALGLTILPSILARADEVIE
jgi:putative ABC transport system substrate-binding protein